MNLNAILDHVHRANAFGPLDLEIGGLTVDSRKVAPGDLFAAIRGGNADGHRFIGAALERGAAAVLAEDGVPEDFRGTWIAVPDSRRGIAEAADAYYGSPSDHLRIAGVTGTNGKTTTAFLLQHLMRAGRGACGLIGTVRYITGPRREEPAPHTTPDWIELQRLLASMRDNGCNAAAMEVSSHALQQLRVHAVRFDAGIFTNLTQDHLDYHGTMENYFRAKAAFFDHLAEQGGPKKPAAVINVDDTWGRQLARMIEGRLRVIRFGMGVAADFRASDITTTMKGTTFRLEARGRTFLVRLPLIGRFNVYNALGALAAVWSMDYNLREAVTALADAPQVPGRMQSVAVHKPFRVFVDYAHTPDALENALRTLRELSPRRIIVVFGCGGDRDRTKRPLMGGVASRLADRVILTSDNPRSEDPHAILQDIRRGIPGENHEMIEDRAAAIARGIELAGNGDIVLIAGKGHEQGQVVGAETKPFDDVKTALGILRRWTLPERP